ncbi:hypothetical protein FRC03_009552 [Tulasnella sp. 419]|nr:hypothetical protein FRC03_009552 [Tulasnella sp. 419]
MTREDPSARPSVKLCIEQFNAIQATITPSRRARRLHPTQPEWKFLEVIRDMRYLFSEGYWAFKPKHKPLPPFQPTEQRSDSLESSEGGEANQQIAKPAEEVVPLSPESRATPSQPLDKHLQAERQVRRRATHSDAVAGLITIYLATWAWIVR